MQCHPRIMSCVMPEPVVVWLYEAGQHLSQGESVCQGTTSQPNVLQAWIGAVEQGRSQSHFSEVSENDLQARREAEEHTFRWQRHHQDRQEWKATTLDKNFRHVPPLDDLRAMDLGKDSWPNSERIDGSPYGPRHVKRHALQLFAGHSGTAHKPPSPRTNRSKEVSTTGMVSLELGRKSILIELNPKYVDLIRSRTNVTPGLALA